MPVPNTTKPRPKSDCLEVGTGNENSVFSARHASNLTSCTSHDTLTPCADSVPPSGNCQQNLLPTYSPRKRKESEKVRKWAVHLACPVALEKAVESGQVGRWESGKRLTRSLSHFLTCGLFFGLWTARAQTNLVFHPDFREVSGQLYNIRQSDRWQDVSGEVVGFATNGIHLQTYRTNRVYETVQPEYRPRLNEQQRAGAYYGGPGRPQPYKRLVSEELMPLKRVFIRNYTNRAAMEGEFVNIRALPLSDTTMDCGVMKAVPAQIISITSTATPKVSAEEERFRKRYGLRPKK